MDRFRKEGDIKLKIFFNSPRPLIGAGKGERVIKKIKNYQFLFSPFSRACAKNKFLMKKFFKMI